MDGDKMIEALERIAESLEYANELKAFELDYGGDGMPEMGDLDGGGEL